MQIDDLCIAISGDLVGSRKISNRNELLKTLESELPKLARQFECHWEAPPQLTRGIDEFSAALTSAGPLFRFFVALNEAVWPHRFRLGVGVGSLDIGRETGNAARLDGPAFHLAAAALTDARQSGRPLIIRAPEMPSLHIKAVEALAEAHAALTLRWTKSSARFVPLMRVSERQREVASTSGVSQQVVSKALIRANFRTLVRIENAATCLLHGDAPQFQERPTPKREADGQ